MDYSRAETKDYHNAVIQSDAEAEARDIMPLQRSSLPVERPTGRKLEEITP